MKTAFLLCAGILSLGIGSAAAADVDLLSFDPLPSAEIKPEPAAPLDVLPPALHADVPRAEIAPAPPAAILKEPPPRPRPPVEIKPADLKPVVETPPAAAAPAITPPPVAALPQAKPTQPPVAKAIELPKVRPVMKMTGTAEPVPSAAGSQAKDIKEKRLPKLAPEPLQPVVVKPTTLNPEVTPPPAPETLVKAPVAVIAVGDPLRIEVSGESDLSGWYKVSPDGSIVLPLIGQVRAQGFTHAKLAEILTATLKDGYLVNPQVSVTSQTEH